MTDAVLEQATGDVEIPDTGDITADLRTGVRDLAHWLTGPIGAPLVVMLQSDAAHLLAVAAAKRRFFASRADVVGRRVASRSSEDSCQPGPTLCGSSAPAAASAMV